MPAVTGRLRRRLRDAVAPAAPTVIDLDAMPQNEQVLFAQVALTTMGLTRGFGRLVVLCAHGSTTENNPYQASLDCGACGGQAGAPNARTAVAILNRAEVRAGLRSLGIDIPADTLFVAAQHDTAVDRVTLLDAHLIPADYHAELDRLERDLTQAGAALAAERCAALPGAAAACLRGRAARHVASPVVGLGAGLPGMGAGRQRRLHRRARGRSPAESTCSAGHSCTPTTPRSTPTARRWRRS